jgi:hypothetical protein
MNSLEKWMKNFEEIMKSWNPTYQHDNSANIKLNEIIQSLRNN